MAEYKIVIFDFDGTLADTSPGIVNSVRYTIEKMNLPEISLEKMYSHIGPPMDESYNRNFGLTGDKLLQAVKYHKEYALCQGFREIAFYDGIIDLLDMLRANNIKVAIATLKAHATAIKILEYFGVAEKFNIITGIDVDAPKTKAQLLCDCIEMSGCKNNEAVLIGDSSYDAIGASEVGIDFIGVTYGFGFKTAEDVKEYPCVAVCDNTQQLTDFLMK